MIVNQWIPAAHRGDAVGDNARGLRALLRRLGHQSDIFALTIDDDLVGDVRPWGGTDARGGDVTILHFAMPSPLTAAFGTLPGARVLCYHNVTPPEFFAPYRPEFAALLAQGRLELAKLAPSFPHAVGDSTFNAEELAAAGFREPGVLPIAVGPEPWAEPADPAWMERLQDGARNVLFVGRVVPNKRHEHLIGMLAHLLAFEPRARLVLAGPEAPDDPYASCLRLLAVRLGVAERVLFTGALTAAELQACYRSAHLFVSLSEHEGFGVPLVEAMWFDVPVVAFAAAAVPETLGDAGLRLREKRLPELAVLAARVLADPSLRERLLQGQRRRREAFRFSALEPRYEAWLERAFGAGSPA